jgi:hypothetical protein
MRVCVRLLTIPLKSHHCFFGGLKGANLHGFSPLQQMDDEFVAVFCAICGSPVPLELAFTHLDACTHSRYEEAVVAVQHGLPADALHGFPVEAVTSLFVNHMPESIWGPVGSKSDDVDARDATEILPGLFLGNTVAAKSVSWLSSHGIGAIVNCAREITPLTGDALAESGVKDVVT